MAYSVREIEDLKARIDSALSGGRLGSWETTFLSDIRARIERYGTRTRFSEKQERKIREIVGRETQPLAQKGKRLSSTRSRPSAYPRRRRRRRGFMARQGRWWARRFVRDFAIAAAFFAVLGTYKLIESGVLPRADIMSIFRGGETKVAAPGTHTVRAANTRPQFTVTDADTIRMHGESKGTRLVGFNTPETFNPRCANELELGQRATARLKELVATSTVEVEMVPCACEPGTEGTDACNFGRSCARLRVDGRDVGEILIAEGLAAPFSCGPTSCPPLPRPWCS